MYSLYVIPFSPGKNEKEIDKLSIFTETRVMQQLSYSALTTLERWNDNIK